MKNKLCLILIMLAVMGAVLPTFAFAAEGGESTYRANSWRYRDGMPIVSATDYSDNMAQSDFMPWSKNEDGLFVIDQLNKPCVLQ